MTRTRDRIPGHLRQFVVEQDYAAYDEIDQAVWRFVLLQTHARLQHTAHPAYREGLARTGIDVERIPRIEAMDRCLAEYGWGAVAVDGFIPPRAFQEFQALGILTIAGDIRRTDHLAYTPAPDIIHESAGHAPIIPDPGYRDYLRRFGEVGRRAFSAPGDRRVYRAVHRMSELLEQPGADPEEVAALGRELQRAHEAQTRPSEATRLSRLHWWTVEYGLVGRPDAYRIYGAGLLSSLGESHFCHDPAVAKRPLSAACVDVDYDITKPQPQLFVAESFEQLNDVLDEVACELAQRRGGAVALERALASEEEATLELDTGLQLQGRLAGVVGGPAAPAYLQLAGPCALARGGRMLAGHGTAEHPDGYGTPIGRLADGARLADLDDRALARRSRGGVLTLDFASGVRVEGRLLRTLRDPSGSGRSLLLCLEDARARRGEELLFRPEWGRYDLATAAEVAAAAAGPADPSYWPATRFAAARVPARRGRPAREAPLLALYRRALALWERPEAPDLLERFAQIEASAAAAFPDEWLLPWNLLECLRKLDRGPELSEALRARLRVIEARFPDDAPISTGLGYLDERYGGGV